ncbi:MAG TPA: Na+/H+ antiporter NhaC family protein, partial [Caldithrix abyssi]|nr:Na+/H+ antiporter NhaC family protein [Caldithrix abyssi]
MKRTIVTIVLILFLHSFASAGQSVRLMKAKPVYLTGIANQLEFTVAAAGDSDLALSLNLPSGQTKKLPLKPDTDRPGIYRSQPVTFGSVGQARIAAADGAVIANLRVIPAWLSILPPILAIILALITRQVLISLLAGIWLGATFIYGYNPFAGFLYTLTEYVGKAPADEERIAILIFSLTLGGMVGVISRSGGTQGIVEKLSTFASNAKRGQFVTWLMGVIIFFDDYANTLIVGNTMRPLTDRLKISREKLSYLVDSTAAPVANIAIISTWIGYELSLINDAFQSIGVNDNAYITFFKTIPYNFYPLFTLAFGLFIALSGRDMFSMLRAERRAQKGKPLRDGAVPLADLNAGDLQTKQGAPLRWYNALVPVAVVIGATLVGLWFTGLNNLSIPQDELSRYSFVRYVSAVVGASDSFAVLMWAAFGGSIVAIVMAIGQRILTLNESMNAWVSGVRAMVMAALILTMA